MTTTDPMSAEVLTALCCTCGEARFVKRNYVGGQPERRLRCEHCRVTTTHAVVLCLDDDARERDNAKPSAPVAPDVEVGVDEIDMLRMMGWNFAVVPGLIDMGCLVESQRLVLMRAGLTATDRAWTRAALLSEALKNGEASRED